MAALVVAWAAVVGGLGCATEAKTRLRASELPPRPPGALDVQLDLGAAADLDLHVTSPDLETVYFGNSPSRAGDARLDRDVRCEPADASSGALRRETVRFDAPIAGRYRVGVDHVKGCRRLRGDARYTIRVRADGLALERSGRIGPGQFQNTALEFDWPPQQPPQRAPIQAPDQAAPGER